MNEPVDLIYFIFTRSLRYTKNFILGISTNYMPVVKFLVCLGVFAYLTSNENPIKSTDS